MTLPLDTIAWRDAAQAAAALLAVLALLWLAGRAFGHTATSRAAGRRLHIEEALALDSRRRLLLVRCDGRDAVLLLGAGGESLLGWLPERAGPNPPA